MTPPKHVEPDLDPERVIKRLGLKSKLDFYFRQHSFTNKAYIIPVDNTYIIGSHQKLSSMLEKNPSEEYKIREVEKRSIDYLISQEYTIKKKDLEKGKTRIFKKN